MTTSHRSDLMSWTAIGVRMGFTSQRTQREEILDAVTLMDWVQNPPRPPYLDSQALQAIVNAVVHHRGDEGRSIVRIGVAQLDGGRQLIGLEDSLGIRSYVLDLDAEAIYVLAECTQPPAVPDVTRPRRVA